jgi:hypothetical protein
MSTQLVHHPVRVGIGVASSEPDQMNRLSSKRPGDLAGNMMSAFHQVGDNNTVSDSFSSIRAKKTLQCGSVT